MVQTQVAIYYRIRACRSNSDLAKVTYTQRLPVARYPSPVNFYRLNETEYRANYKEGIKYIAAFWDGTCRNIYFCEI